VIAADPTLVRLIQWETLEGHGQILGAVGAQAHSFVKLIQELGARSGVPDLDERTATELLVDVAAMCWFPHAHADALGRTFHWDPHSAATVESQTKTIVEFVLMRLDGLQPPPPA
jgi:hypothetical protein